MSERIKTLFYLLARELGESCESAPKTCHEHLATKCDLEQLERRLMEKLDLGGISSADKESLDALLRRSKKIVEKLERLDSQNPPSTP